jgi:hypothetical protein
MPKRIRVVGLRARDTTGRLAVMRTFATIATISAGGLMA